MLLDRVHRVTQELVEASKIAELRAQGPAWKKISRKLGVGVSTVLRITQESRKSGSENPKPKNFPNSCPQDPHRFGWRKCRHSEVSINASEYSTALG